MKNINSTKNSKVKSFIKFDDEIKEDVVETKKEKKEIKQQTKQKIEIKQKQLQHITIAFPDSIVSNAQSSELRSYFMSQLARIFAMFKVDSVIILRDYSYLTKSQQFDASSYIARNLQYLETPQYLRKNLFPIHSDLKNVGLMNAIESKHHLKTEDVCIYREGVVVERPTKGDTAWVEIGLKKQVLINYPLQAGTRVTLKLDDPDAAKLTGVPVSTEQVKKDGYYWGYSVQIESKFHKFLERDDFDLKVLIQSDNKDKQFSQDISFFNKDQFEDYNNILILFSGFESITNFAENDEKSKLKSEEIYEHFNIIYRYNSDHYGVKQLRLEEQMFMFLQKLRN